MQIHTSASITPALVFWRPLAALAQAWHALAADWAASYRPEKHYMRGPGPKWHAKHARQHDTPAH